MSPGALCVICGCLRPFVFPLAAENSGAATERGFHFASYVEMSRSLSNRSLRTLLISLPLLGLVAVSKPVPKEPGERTVMTRDAFWVAKTHSPAKFDLVILGDSAAYCGLSPRALSRSLPGYRILNFAYSAGGLNGAMFRAAEAKLDPKSTRKSILLAVTPLSLTARSMGNGKFLAEMGRPREYIFEKLHPAFVWDLVKPIGQREIAIMLGLPTPDGDDATYSEYHADGWVAVSARQVYPDASVPTYRKLYSEGKVLPALVRGLMEQTAAWTKAGVKVFGVACPRSPEVAAVEAECSGFDPVGFVRDFRRSGGIWLPVAGEYESIDGVHLCMRDALRFSADVAQQIAASLRK